MKIVSSKNVKKLNTNKKNILNIDEMNAFKVAYGKPLNTKEYFTYIGLPALSFAVLTFMVFFYWWLSLIAGVLGAVYGIKVVLPKNVEKNYQQLSFSQRNIFINNMTQILTDEGKTVPSGLVIANQRAKGEYQKDISQLQATLFGADYEKIQYGFKRLNEKYEDDIIFTQYLEQLETAMIEGRTNIETLKDIKTQHNDMKKKQNEYQLQKKSHLMGIKTICTVSIFFIVAIIFAGTSAFGFEAYINMYPHHPTGWITGGIYMTNVVYQFSKFSKILFDESVLEVQL